jgi:tetratricopeptide (TPR) repeat protein
MGLEGVSNVGSIAFKHKDYSTTINCFNFIVENSENSEGIIKSKLYLLYASMETSNDLNMVNTQFQDLFAEFGKNANTIDIQIAYADFLAFEMNESEKGIEILRETLNFRLDEFQKGEIKISLGELLVFDGEFNEALVYFSQVQTRLKNHTLAQNARFKVAQTSYYKGDFKWAQTQLKVLKQSTSQRISNDAIELSLIISDNSVQDSLKLALKSYARADLLAFQNKNEQAVDTLNELLRNHKGHAIEDEALFKQGEIFEKIKSFDKAASNYIRLIEINDQDILVDDAYYRLAEISLKQNKLEKAKEYYQKIIFDYSSSIYMVDARKKFRTLRGDDLQ